MKRNIFSQIIHRVHLKDGSHTICGPLSFCFFRWPTKESFEDERKYGLIDHEKESIFNQSAFYKKEAEGIRVVPQGFQDRHEGVVFPYDEINYHGAYYDLTFGKHILKEDIVSHEFIHDIDFDQKNFTFEQCDKENVKLAEELFPSLLLLRNVNDKGEVIDLTESRFKIIAARNKKVQELSTISGGFKAKHVILPNEPKPKKSIPKLINKEALNNLQQARLRVEEQSKIEKRKQELDKVQKNPVDPFPEDLSLEPKKTEDTASKGLGDTIAKITTAVGIKPCEGCKKRREWFNKHFPYKSK